MLGNQPLVLKAAQRGIHRVVAEGEGLRVLLQNLLDRPRVQLAVQQDGQEEHVEEPFQCLRLHLHTPERT